MQKKFDDQVSENNSEFTGYDLKGPSLSDIPNLKEINPFQIETLRIMHSPNIKSMKVSKNFSKYFYLSIC